MRYRRANVPGGTYFFTVNLAERKKTLLADHIGRTVGWGEYNEPQHIRDHHGDVGVRKLTPTYE